MEAFFITESYRLQEAYCMFLAIRTGNEKIFKL